MCIVCSVCSMCSVACGVQNVKCAHTVELQWNATGLQQMVEIHWHAVWNVACEHGSAHVFFLKLTLSSLPLRERDKVLGRLTQSTNYTSRSYLTPI